MYKRIIYNAVIVFFSLCNNIKAQSYQELLQSEIPLSPMASEFMKYGNYAMNYTTGVPQISIPIYTIKEGNVSVPISLDYHASGIKVQEIPSCVGLGWQLSVSGCISVETRGLKDKFQPLPACSSQEVYDLLRSREENATSKHPYYNPYTISDYDSESDVYNYSFLGHSGSFRFSYPDTVLHTVPYEPLIIKPVISTSDPNYINGFTIRDSEGNLYLFDHKEETSVFDCRSISSWYLTKIQPSQSKECIEFLYRDSPQNWFFRKHSYIAPNSCLSRTDDGSLDIDTRIQEYPIDCRIDVCLLSSISWRSNQILFDYSHNDYADTNTFNKLKAVSVQNICGDTIHHTNLVQSIQSNPTYQASSRMMLDEVTVNGDTYKFEYNERRLPSYTRPHSIPNPGNCYEDFWGFYNNEEITRHWYPQEFTDGSEPEYWGTFAIRTPNESYAKAASLKKIYYPTGGYSEFELESNYISDNHIWGGLRLKSVTNYDNNNQVINRKSYRYEMPVTSEYILDTCTMLLKKDLYYKGTPHELCGEVYIGIHDFRDWHYELHGAPFRSIMDGGAPLHYLKVTEYDGDFNVFDRKTVYEYQRHYFNIENYINNYDHDTDKIFLWDPEYAYDRGTPFFPLVRKTIYSNDSDVPIYEERCEYRCDTLGKFRLGFTYRPIKTMEGNNFPEVISAYDFFHLFSIYDVYCLPSFDVLTKRTVIKDSILQTEEYEYDPMMKTLNPIRIISSQSDGSSVIKEYTYPLTQSEMYESNILLPTKETIYSSKNGELRQIHTQTVKYEHYSDFWYQSEIATGIEDSPEQKIKYLYNEFGHISCAIIDSTIYHNIIYGYDGTLPIAVVLADRKISCPNILTTDENVLKTQISRIRSQYEDMGYLVRTFLHKPLVGIYWEQETDGVETTYQYDRFGRLVKTFDRLGYMKNSIKYNYEQ